MSASALSGAPAGTTFISVKVGQQVQHFLSVPAVAGAEGIAFRVAQSMAARSVEVEDLPVEIARVPVIVRARFQTGTDPFPDTQSGAEFTTLSKVIGNTLMDGDWVACVVRGATRSEPKRQARWLDHYFMRTHHSRKSGAVLASFYTGSRENAHAHDVMRQVMQAIPGFGLSTSSTVVSPWRSAWRWFLVGLVGVAVMLLGLLVEVPEFLAEPWQVVRSFWSVGLVLAVIGAAGGVLTLAWVLPSPAKRLRALLGWGLLPSPAHRLRPPRKPHQASSKSVKNSDGTYGTKQIEAFGGDYPMQVDTFMIGAHLALAMVAPFSNQSGQARSGERSVPAQLVEKVGPVLGDGPTGERVHLPVQDMYGGVGLMGQAGSGKTAWMESCWGECAFTRANGAPLGQDWPTRNVMIAFDTKGDREATRQYAAWSAHAGDTVQIIDIFDRAPGVGLNMFPDFGDGAMVWGKRVAAAFSYAYGDEFRSRSFDTVSRVFAAAKMITPEVVGRVASSYRIRPDASAFYYADILLTNHGDDTAQELVRALRAHADDTHNAGDDSYDEIGEWLSSLYGPGITPAKRRDLAEAPRTKIAKLMIAEPFLAVDEPLTWQRILQDDLAVILNFGKSVDGFLADSEIRNDMAAMMLYTLWEEIQRSCGGWFEARRAIWLCADEFKHLAAENAAVIKAMRQDGRAFGLRLILATQEPSTLPTDVLKMFLGFATMLYFAQDEPSTLAAIVGDLSAGGGTWEASDIANLANFQAIARVRVRSGRLEPFTITTVNARAERDKAAA